jgi:hypothetical protein
MPVIKELQDIVDLLGEHDEEHQRSAIKSLMYVLDAADLDAAEQDIADGDLSEAEQRFVQRERFLHRAEVRRQKFLALVERMSGKANAEKLQAEYEKSVEEALQRPGFPLVKRRDASRALLSPLLRSATPFPPSYEVYLYHIRADVPSIMN